MSDSFVEKVKSIFEGKNPPFLFIGSGFSRRHIELPDFDTLLRETCCLEGMKEYEYYKIKASSDLPKTALFISEDFRDMAWRNSNLINFIDSYKENFIKSEDVYKYYISEYIKLKHGTKKISGYNHICEIEKLKSASIDGIITTNYDTFLEEIFPDFKAFSGQDELIQKNPQFIAEIYKIHGSVDSPRDIVVTSNDYIKFEEKNKYLVAKLLSTFIERPILFIGYSIRDAHIQKIIVDMCKCCSGNIDSIQDNLIFLTRSHDREKSCSRSILSVENYSIPYWHIACDDFGEVYNQIKSRRKIPVNLFRLFKEQIYEICLTGTPTEKIRLIEDNNLNSDNIQFLVGIGVGDLRLVGYEGIKRPQIIEDVLFDNKKFVPFVIIDSTIANYFKSSSSNFIPFYKYLFKLGVNNQEKLIEIGFAERLKKGRDLEIAKYSCPQDTYKKFFSRISHNSFDDIIESTNDLSYLLKILPMLATDKAKADIDRLGDFLRDKYNQCTEEKYSTDFAKVVCFYDRMKYGWD